MSPRLLAAMLAGLALAACALEPARHSPPVKLDPTAAGLRGPNAPEVAEDWWHAFGDPQLDALVDLALRDSPSLAEAIARLARARADADVAAGAQSPQLAVTGETERTRLSARSAIPPPYGGGSFWDSRLSAGLGWELDFWGRQRDRIRAADRFAYAREIEIASARTAIEVAILTKYVELDDGYALAELADQEHSARQHLAELSERRVVAGLDTNVERQTVAARVPEARTDRDEALALVGLVGHQLAALAGQGAGYYDEIGRPRLHYEAALPVPAALPGDLLLRRGDVRAALALVEAAAAEEDAARLARYPDINLRAFAGFAALTLTDLLTAPARTYGAGPVVALPIFDGGVLRARLHAANAALDGAVARYNMTALGAVREVADQLLLIETLARERGDAATRAEILGQAHQLARRRFDAGITSQAAVLEAELRWLAARRSFATVRGRETQARVVLVAALGGPPVTAPPAPSSAQRISR